MNKETTTIWVSEETEEKLDKLKLHSRETPEDVLRRLLENSKQRVRGEKSGSMPDESELMALLSLKSWKNVEEDLIALVRSLNPMILEVEPSNGQGSSDLSFYGPHILGLLEEIAEKYGKARLAVTRMSDGNMKVAILGPTPKTGWTCIRNFMRKP